MDRDKVYLKHIIEAITTIEDYIRHMTFDDFLIKKMMQDAVVRELEIIGEAARNISDKTRNDFREIPWTVIVDMRNKLIHEYFGVDLKAVWKTILEDLPRLKQRISDGM